MKKFLLLFVLLFTFLQSRAGVEFDGVDDYLSFSTSPVTNYANDCTISLWAKASLLDGTARRLIHFVSGSTTNIQISGYNASGRVMVRWNASGTDIDVITSAGTLTTNTWYHICVTQSGGSVTIFINGTSSSGGVGTSHNTAAGSVIGGRGAASSARWQGLISEVQVYSRVLNQAEISNLSSSRTKGPKFSDLTYYWPLDSVADGASADGATFVDRAGTANATGNDGADNTGLTGKAEDYLSYP